MAGPRALPPPNSLVAFQAAAQQQSFTRAARELGVSQAAISRHIRILEDFLGVSLFQRGHRSVTLTPVGQSYHRAVAYGFDHIARATSEIRRDQAGGDITIATSVSFATYWLMARIARFRATHPELDLHMVASARQRDFAISNADLAIRYGRGTWPNAHADHLFDNEVFPVCSPAYLRRHRPLDKVNDLLNQTLLQLDRFDRNWVTWESWLGHFHAKDTPKPRYLTFDSYMVLIQGALGGQGVALCGARLAQDFLDQGQLVRPLAASLRSESGFYLLHAADRPLRRNAALFRAWLLEEARGVR